MATYLGEGAGAVVDGAGAGQVGVRGGQALLVVQGLVGLGLGQQVLNLVGHVNDCTDSIPFREKTDDIGVSRAEQHMFIPA